MAPLFDNTLHLTSFMDKIFGIFSMKYTDKDVFVKFEVLLLI